MDYGSCKALQFPYRVEQDTNSFNICISVFNCIQISINNNKSLQPQANILEDKDFDNEKYMYETKETNEV